MWTNTGTVQYKAPEMFAGQYNELIDVWAVGVITYEMIFRKMPFNKELVKDTVNSICNEEIEFDSSLVTPALIHFLKKTLTKNPLKRITAMEALQTPFMLKFMSVSSSSSSPKMRRRSVTNTD
jgi:serine/threonine protein kinase